MIDLQNKYIHAEAIGDIKGKAAWVIVNTKSGQEIGCVAFYPAWKRYVMFTDTPAIFDTGCLKSIIAFIDKQNLSSKPESL